MGQGDEGRGRQGDKAMSRALYIFRWLLVVATAIFVAYHSQIFIRRIEENIILSWLAALIIEGMLISLALSRSIMSRVLLVPVFLISVIAASASFIVQNEQLLDQFFTRKRILEQLERDLLQTQKAYELGQRYATKTLQRERQLNDKLLEVISESKGSVALLNAIIFLLLVLTMQSVSVYTAMSLKGGLSEVKQGAETVKQDTETPTETVKQDTETLTETVKQDVKQGVKQDTEIPMSGVVRQLRSEGYSYREIARKTGLSVAKISRLLR